MTASAGVRTGNAAADAAARGWFVGLFLPADDLLATEAVEVKWAVYHGGEARHAWGANRAATTLAVLVRGRFHFSLPDRDVVLARERNYLLWPPGVPHL